MTGEHGSAETWSQPRPCRRPGLVWALGLVRRQAAARAAAVEEWEAFLADDPPEVGVRPVLRKKTSSAPGTASAEALDVALFRLDRRPARVDDYVAQAFTPRRSRSPSGLINQ